jgi:hypothetical protein
MSVRILDQEEINEQLEKVNESRQARQEERSFLRKWIFEHTKKQWQKEVNNMIFVSYPYEKYGEFVLAFKAGKSAMNVQFCNLSKDFTDGLYIGYQETLPAVEYLGERIALALNYFTGKSNKEIENLLEGQKTP